MLLPVGRGEQYQLLARRRRGRSRDGGSFTRRSRPTGDDASLKEDGDRERLRRDPRLTTESSRAISAAQESQSIAAARARLPFTASWSVSVR